MTDHIAEGGGGGANDAGGAEPVASDGDGDPKQESEPSGV